MLGALAIVIAILIVLNAQDRKDQEQTPPPTITNTITETTPFIADRDAGLDRPGGHRSWWSRIRGNPTSTRSRRPATVQVTPPLTEPQGQAALDSRTDMAMTTPQHLSDRYELGEILGFGGMSEVHLARDQRLHRDVAVKVLRADLARDPSFYLRFRREAQNAAALNHPAIVAVYDTGEAETPNGPLPYIVMEYVEGVTLRDIVHTEGPMEPQRAIEVIADACQALNFSHQHGIIHRDVKPANIMISKAGAVKVMDFGIARALADASNVTQTAAVIGTAQYLSPEQARGEKVDARSDVYSLGCVLYEMLTGEPPFVGDSPVAVAYQHVREDPVPPSQRHEGISPELDAVVLKALAKNPDNRYQTAAEMRADLVKVHSGEQPDAPKVFTDAERSSLMSAQPARSPDRAHRRRRASRSRSTSSGSARGSVGRWLIAVAVLAVLTVVVTIAINMFGGGTRDVQVPDVSGQVSADAIADAAEPRLQDPHPAEAGLQRPARPRHRHRPGRQLVGRRRRRDHHQRVHRPRAARDSRRQGPELRRRRREAHRCGLRELPAVLVAVDTRDEGQGARHQPAGQPDVGDHQRDHHRGGRRARRLGRSPT